MVSTAAISAGIIGWVEVVVQALLRARVTRCAFVCTAPAPVLVCTCSVPADRPKRFRKKYDDQ